MIKVRTAKKTFTDTFGNEVKEGEAFGIVELRPLFVSRSALEKALADLNTPPKASESAEGGR